MKEEIVKQGLIPFLLECTTKVGKESLTPLLELIWSLTFLPEAAVAIRKDASFLQQVENISQGTSDDALQKAVGGLRWKLLDGRTATNLEQKER